MSNLQFQEEQVGGNPLRKKNGKIVSKIISLGIAKDAKQANYVLLGIAAASILITVLALVSTGSSAPATADWDGDVDPETGIDYGEDM